MIFEGTTKETKNTVVEEEFLSAILKVANEFISFRETLFKIDCLGSLKAVMSEITLWPRPPRSCMERYHSTS